MRAVTTWTLPSVARREPQSVELTGSKGRACKRVLARLRLSAQTNLIRVTNCASRFVPYIVTPLFDRRLSARVPAASKAFREPSQAELGQMFGEQAHPAGCGSGGQAGFAGHRPIKVCAPLRARVVSGGGCGENFGGVLLADGFSGWAGRGRNEDMPARENGGPGR